MTMVLCCPVKLWPLTKASLRAHAPSARVIPIDADTITEPWDTYADHWALGEDLVIVEQDVILHAQVLPQFEECPEPWCLFPGRNDCRGGDFQDTGLMCNRFRQEFMAKVTIQAIEAVPGCCWRCEGKNPKCWQHLDGRIRAAGEAAGFRIHVHWPSVGHRHWQPGETPQEGDHP